MKVVHIDDDPDVLDVVSMCFELGWPGSKIIPAPDGQTGIEAVQKENPDVVLLDVGLPDIEGFEVYQKLRRFSDIPVIFLTVHDREADIVRGLEMGAADYITKPFSHIELLARVRAILRRVQMWPLGKMEPPYISDKLAIDFDTREVRVAGQEVKLTDTEYRLLTLLVKNAGQVLTHHMLLEEVWGPEYRDAGNLLRVHMQHLRKKLGDDVEQPTVIVTERGRGYKFVQPK